MISDCLVNVTAAAFTVELGNLSYQMIQLLESGSTRDI